MLDLICGTIKLRHGAWNKCKRFAAVSVRFGVVEKGCGHVLWSVARQPRGQTPNSWWRGGGSDTHKLRCGVRGRCSSRTPASVTEQYNLVVVDGLWCSEASKVTTGHMTCDTTQTSWFTLAGS